MKRAERWAFTLVGTALGVMIGYVVLGLVFAVGLVLLWNVAP